MRAVIVVAVLLLILGLIVLVGWVGFSSPDGDPTLRVDTDKVQRDTSAIVENAKEVANEAAVNIDKAAKSIDASIDRDSEEVK
jgi:predicted PurR-regulated permease PerM